MLVWTKVPNNKYQAEETQIGPLKARVKIDRYTNLWCAQVGRTVYQKRYETLNEAKEAISRTASIIDTSWH